MKHSLFPRVALACVATVAISQSGLSQTFTDNFDRADTTFSFTNPPTVGADYEILQTGTSTTTSGWRISSNELLVGDQTGGAKLMAQTDLGSLNTAGKSFTLQTDIALTSITNGRWVGMAFNIESSGNFYAVRLGYSGGNSTLQFIRTVNLTSNTSLGSMTTLQPVAANTFYRLTITSDEAYNFDVSLSTIGSTPMTIGTLSNVTDGTSAYSDGLSGFYAVTGNPARFDNYSLTVVPEPGVTALLIAGFGMMVIVLRRRRSAAV